MPLIDALKAGSDWINSMSKGAQESVKARYAYPMAQEQLKYDQTTNQYRPDQMRLANINQENVNQNYNPDHEIARAYQKLVNDSYADDINSQIRKRNLESDYIPLDKAINVEKALKEGSSRFGGSYEYIRGINAMNSDEKKLYFSEPTHAQQYNDELQVLHSEIQRKNDSADKGAKVLTPDFLEQFGFKSLADFHRQNPGATAKGGLASPRQMPQQQQQPTMGGMTPMNPQVSQYLPGGAGIAAPLQGMTPRQQPFTPPPQQPGFTPIGAPPIQAPAPQYQTPMQVKESGDKPQMPRLPYGRAPTDAEVVNKDYPATIGEVQKEAEAKKIAQSANLSPEDVEKEKKKATTTGLSNSDKNLYSSQMLANKALVGSKVMNQAIGAVQFENLLMNNRGQFSQAFKDASQYAGIIGQGKFAMEKFQKNHSEAYGNYLWVTKDLIPKLTNNEKRMEALGSTDRQRIALNDMYHAVLKWDSDPDTAVANINKTIGLFGAQAKAAIRSAEPRWPGALEKLYGIHTNPVSDYISKTTLTTEQQKEAESISTDELLALYKKRKG